MIVTQKQFDIACEVERLAKEFNVPKSDLLEIVRMGFELGQIDGLTKYAEAHL